MVEVFGYMQPALLHELQRVGIDIHVEVVQRYRLHFPKDGVLVNVLRYNKEQDWSILEYKGIKFLVHQGQYSLFQEKAL